MIEKRITLIGTFFILISIFVSSLVLADGGYFPRPGYWVRPGQQRAIIFHEGNVETLILTSGFQGNAKDLVWIIPTPTKPEITKANEKVFTNVAKLVTPQYSYGFGYELMAKSVTGVEEEGVVVIESKQVDYYDVNVLVAANSQDLVKWFNENNYSYPEEYAYVLNHYIDKGWFFTAIKVSPEAQGATEVIQDLKEGNPTPVKMVFLSEKIVFPLKISSVDFKPKDEVKYGAAKDEAVGATRKDKDGNIWTKVTINLYGEGEWNSSSFGSGRVVDSWIDMQPGGINYYEEDYRYRYSNYIPIQLYVIADSKYEADEFYIQYGNWVKKSQIEELGDDENGKPFLQPKSKKYFLTSLSASMQKSQMDDDVYLKKAKDNQKVNAEPETWQIFVYGLIIGLILFTVWIFTPLGIMFIAGSLILFLSSNKIARVFGWVMETFSFVVTLVIGIIIFALAAANSSLGNYIVISWLVTCLLLLGIMLLLIILQIKYKKERE